MRLTAAVSSTTARELRVADRSRLSADVSTTSLVCQAVEERLTNGGEQSIGLAPV